VLAVAAPAGADAPGMGAFNYYVGAWACVGGAAELPPVTGWVTYEMDGSALRSAVAVPVQKRMTRAWLTVETKFDAAKNVYVDTAFDNGGWDVSWARPWSGNTEEWVDRSTATGKLGRDRVTRIDGKTFVHTRYQSLTGSDVDFRIKCTRRK
jgi:hypothetical protein